MESSYAETLKELFARLPNTVQVPSHLLVGDRSSRVVRDVRRFARRTVNGEMLCQLDTALPAVPRRKEVTKVVSLDVSRNGFGFLMDRQLYPGEEVLLWTKIGRVPCGVVRCLKHGERCYEIGVEIR